MKRSSENSMARLIAAEPYRVFFPFAILLGVAGVLMWPLFYKGYLGHYPLQTHARVMIEGFVGGFAIGFLGTALPKMMKTAHFTFWQVLSLLVLLLGSSSLHMAGEMRMGDALFSVTMLLMLCLLFFRLKRRGGLPPAVMILAGMGLVSGTFGALWSAIYGFEGNVLVGLFAHRLLYQAFILLSLLGVGSFMFPLIFNSKVKPKSMTPSAVQKLWNWKALECLSVGVLILLSYWIEIHGEVQKMSWVRAIVCFIWFTKETEWLTQWKVKGVMSLSLRAGIFCLIGGMVATGVTLQNKIAVDHTLYIGGFGLVAIIVASRVIYGHSAQDSQFQRWQKPLTICAMLILLSMATRVTADFMPQLRISHHIYAAGCWIVATLVWGVAVFTSLKKRAQKKERLPKQKLFSNIAPKAGTLFGDDPLDKL